MNLNTYQYHRKELDSIKEEIAELRSVMQSVGAQEITDMPKAQSYKNMMEENMIRLEALETARQAKIQVMLDEMERIERLINTLPGIEPTIMRYKYINGWTLEKIAVEISYSYRQVRRKHARAIKRLSSHVPIEK